MDDICLVIVARSNSKKTKTEWQSILDNIVNHESTLTLLTEYGLRLIKFKPKHQNPLREVISFSELSNSVYVRFTMPSVLRSFMNTNAATYLTNKDSEYLQQVFILFETIFLNKKIDYSEKPADNNILDSYNIFFTSLAFDSGYTDIALQLIEFDYDLNEEKEYNFKIDENIKKYLTENNDDFYGD